MLSRTLHRHLDVEGVRVFYRESLPERADAPVLLLLHGFRDRTPPALITWGADDPFFPAPGARAYLHDLPDAELHLFSTGHFALETHLSEIAPLIAGFLDRIGP